MRTASIQWRRRFVVIVAALSIAAISTCVLRSSVAVRPVPKPLPVFDLPDINGDRVDVDNLRGRVVLVGFFESLGFGANEAQLRLLKRLSDQRRADGLSVVVVAEGWSTGLDAEDERRGHTLSIAHAERLRSLQDMIHIDFPIVDDVDCTVQRAYGRAGPHDRPAGRPGEQRLYADPAHCLPSTYVFDRMGRQRDQRCGFTLEDSDILTREVDDLLRE